MLLAANGQIGALLNALQQGPSAQVWARTLLQCFRKAAPRPTPLAVGKSSKTPDTGLETQLRNSKLNRTHTSSPGRAACGVKEGRTEAAAGSGDGSEKNHKNQGHMQIEEEDPHG